MRLTILLSVLLLLLPGIARADEEEEETRSYGAQILLVDAITGTMTIPGFIAAANRSAKPEVYLGAAAYALGGPAVHVFHRQYGRAFGSFTLRLLPMVGLIALANKGDSRPRGPEPRCVAPENQNRLSCEVAGSGGGRADGLGQIGGVVLAALGMVVATAIDAAALAKEPVPRVKPTASMTSSTWTVGLEGTF